MANQLQTRPAARPAYEVDADELLAELLMSSAVVEMVGE